MLSPWTRECSQGLKWAGTTLNGVWHTVFLLAKGIFHGRKKCGCEIILLLEMEKNVRKRRQERTIRFLKMKSAQEVTW